MEYSFKSKQVALTFAEFTGTMKGPMTMADCKVIAPTNKSFKAYLGGEPADDARFVAVFAHSLQHAGGYTPQEAKRVAGTLLPDILPYDPKRPASFPNNGRTLTDDAVDVFLPILTNGKVTGDKVGPHSDLLGQFPYLGPPHNT